jgi:hypothetical protein
MRRIGLLVGLAFGVTLALSGIDDRGTCFAPAAQAGNGKAKLLKAERIWDQGKHNAFTDLVRFKDRWYCVFREGTDHNSPDGVLRVIRSADAKRWDVTATLSLKGLDLRDPKILVTPDGRLMLLAGAWKAKENSIQSLVWFSDDGVKWSDETKVGEPNVWLWRVLWHKGTAYGVGYTYSGKLLTRLYTSKDGVKFEHLVDTLFDRGNPNESALLFLEDDTLVCLLRRDPVDINDTKPWAQLGIAKAPYKEWQWKDLGIQAACPQMLRLPDGRIAVGARLYKGGMRFSLLWLDVNAGTLMEDVNFPTLGANEMGYPGMVWHNGRLWLSYYSSHEKPDYKASIYMAQVDVGKVK